MTTTTDPYPRQEITGAILAGGRATRMGGEDKGLATLGGRAMIEYSLHALRPQVGALLINANRNLDRYRHYGYPVVADELEGFQGPLAGMARLLARATTPYVLTVPCDSPLLAPDLAERLYRTRAEDDAQIAVAFDGERMQPVFALLECTLLPSLLVFLREGNRKIDLWYERHRYSLSDLSDRPDTFLNINTPGQRAQLESRLVQLSPGGGSPS